MTGMTQCLYRIALAKGLITHKIQTSFEENKGNYIQFYDATPIKSKVNSTVVGKREEKKKSDPGISKHIQLRFKKS